MAMGDGWWADYSSGLGQPSNFLAYATGGGDGGQQVL